MKKLLILTVIMLATACNHALGQDSPVHFTYKERKLSADETELTFSATIDDTWHVFSTKLPQGGPVPTSLTLEHIEGARPIGSLTAKGERKEEYSRDFGMTVGFYEKNVTFSQRFRLTGGKYRIRGYLEYATCNDQMCMPPTAVEFDVAGVGAEKSEAIGEKPEISGEKSEVSGERLAQNEENGELSTNDRPQDTLQVVTKTKTKTGTITKTRAITEAKTATSSSPLYLFLMGIGGGLLALCTPCVWPIIPMTVSFFLKRSKNRRKGIRDAIGYGLSIIAVFLSLGIAVSLMGRGNWLNGLATNSIFNLLLCLLLIVFALSFFGWFEIRLPARWADKADTKAGSTTGWLSLFLMALTLVLVSFSCTAPIVGLLLVEASTSGLQAGAMLGMLGFALALALPFTLFALFPSWLKQLPKSGSWMNTIKVSLGFIELAFACKFFSVADLAYGWHLMPREVFLVLWIAIFLSLGLYLMGLLRFPSDADALADAAGNQGSTQNAHHSKSVPSIVTGMCSIAFSLYMVPGLWGAPCRAIAAFAPPMSTQDFNLNSQQVTAAYTDYDEGVAAAKRLGKPVLIDFTGFGCVNCRKMEAAVWTDPSVARILNNDYVLISLYVDDKTPLPQREEVENADGSTRTLRTVGDKWSYLEETRFGHLAQPFYVAADADGNPLTSPYAYDESIPAYLSFLQRGLTAFRTAQDHE